MPIGTEVCVVGAGVAGLAVARALALRGARVTVLEQADAIREVGAGLQISPNGFAVLRALGLDADLAATAPRARAVVLVDGPSGAQVLRMRLGDRPFHLVHRADLIDLLARGARDAGVEFRLLQKVETVELTDGRPLVRLATGAEMRPALLLGADGLHSKVRAALNGAVAPFFTFMTAWRATIPCDPADPPEAEVHLGPGRHLVSYPLRDGTLRNIVAVEERRRWVDEGWHVRDDPLELRLAFAEFNPRVTGWLEAVDEVGLWGLFRHPVARRWHDDTGRVAILGDAAHPTLPFLAQGANLALEDAWVLAASLAGHDTPAAGLAAYQLSRAARAARTVAAANAQARNYHLGGLLRPAAHALLRLSGLVAPRAALQQYAWLHDHDVTATG